MEEADEYQDLETYNFQSDECPESVQGNKKCTNLSFLDTQYLYMTLTFV